ncbi:hypothetical protein [Spirillospora sp. NPDC047279]|uniref:hypothetical protein n=1 Tax=Spirillospora sp. NPDC047279 TaxID=3155478 RepID=UPI003405C2B2
MLIDVFYGATGGPQGKPPKAGATMVITDPQTGRKISRTVAGVLTDGIVFYGAGGVDPRRFPVLMSRQATTDLFGAQARPSSLLIRLTPGTDPAQTASRLQGRFLTQGLVSWCAPSENAAAPSPYCARWASKPGRYAGRSTPRVPSWW